MLTAKGLADPCWGPLPIGCCCCCCTPAPPQLACPPLQPPPCCPDTSPELQLEPPVGAVDCGCIPHVLIGAGLARSLLHPVLEVGCDPGVDCVLVEATLELHPEPGVEEGAVLIPVLG